MNAMPRDPAFPPWDNAELPEPPRFRAGQWASLIGPGLLMAGANIGAGEWLFGPLLTAKYGGAILWVATLSILLQVCYNLSVMRYALYCGESIFVGFFRTPPGPAFWLPAYVILDLGSYLPYAAHSAAVPIAAFWLKRPLTDDPVDTAFIRAIGYGLFALAFVPLVFGGKVYNSLERVMVAKLVLVLGFLSVVVVLYVSSESRAEIFSGFFRFGELPAGVNWAQLAAFAAFAGAGGLSNTAFSSYARDKGWGMGSVVGAIPSAVGGKTIQLSHTGKKFEATAENLRRWGGWLRHVLRDQCVLWAPACMIGMALPSMLSYEFVRGGTNATGNAIGSVSAFAIGDRHGSLLWLLTLLCGFAIIFPTQISNIDGLSRRWTDVLWVGLRPLRRLGGHQVKLVYYTILGLYAAWGFMALSLSPSPAFTAILNGVLMNLGMGVSALHVIYVSWFLLPRHARLPWILQLGLVGCGVFYIGISALTLAQKWPDILYWLRSL